MDFSKNEEIQDENGGEKDESLPQKNDENSYF